MRDNSSRACESLRSVLVCGSSTRRMVLFMGTPSPSTMDDRDQCAERSSDCARAMNYCRLACPDLGVLDEDIELMPQPLQQVSFVCAPVRPCRYRQLARGSLAVLGSSFPLPRRNVRCRTVGDPQPEDDRKSAREGLGSPVRPAVSGSIVIRAQASSSATRLCSAPPDRCRSWPARMTCVRPPAVNSKLPSRH